MAVNLQWNGKMGFVADPPSGVRFTLDAHPDFGGEGLGPTPVEAMLASIAACSAMDVIAILRKKQQTVDSYTLEVDGDKAAEGDYPRPFTAIRLNHVLSGPGLDPVAVARAIQLSDDKYCTVMATLKFGPKFSTSWEIKDAVPG
ncbi:MAG TPA: OsmC family protein [Fimbriimonadaceae bacterium]|jgi:putative redox protein